MSNLSDLIGGADLFQGSKYSYTYDRFNNSNSAIYFDRGYLQVPQGNYFSGDFTFTAWIYLKLCQNITCSKQGICLVVNDTQPVCKCFPNFSGNKCEISSFKMKTIKTVGFISVGFSIAFMAGFVGLIIYIDIVRFLRPDHDNDKESEERMRNKEKKKKEKKQENIELTQVQNQNQTIRLETITEENDKEQENEFGITRASN